VSTLDLALIGNGTISALLNPAAEIVWGCFPRFDGDPAFCALLRSTPEDAEDAIGIFSVTLIDQARQEQHYLANTPILVTRLFDSGGACVEITDFAPRFRQFGRMFCPMTLVRQVRRISGNPRLRVHIRPAHHYGHRPQATTWGSNHVRYVGTDLVLRLTTDASITALLEENAFFLDETVTFLIGPDETVQGSVAEVGRRFFEETTNYWRTWVRALAIPFEWQDDVIRAAITLKLNAYEDTGAVVAAMTTSIPEAPDSGRNWDYRFCWLRDAYFVVNALNQLGATRTMEQYLRYIVNIVAGADEATLKPLYAISGRAAPDEVELDSLDGYRGMGPVRVGNQAVRQVQHDVYGSAILAATHVFFDRRLVHRGDEVLFRRLETLGELAIRLYDQPDAGLWELRGSSHVHTFSSVMCWAGCDRLAKIGAHLGLVGRSRYWREKADAIHEVVCRRAWNPKLESFTATLDGDTLDASLLRLQQLGFLCADDPRFAGTVRAIERDLRDGDFVFRYIEPDDFGRPENAFLVCTFWYIDALAALGRRDEARALFEKVLACRNRHGLLAEHIDPRTHEQWGNFVQTYSMVGIIQSAIRLSLSWDEAS
jgi:GH15 family glucan-1,4-alpha-glucosidase